MRTLNVFAMMTLSDQGGIFSMSARDLTVIGIQEGIL